MFKVGDRVKVISGDLCDNIGTVRVVLGIHLGVEFDEYIDGHALNDTCEFGKGCYVLTENLELIERDIKVFKVGDKVRVSNLDRGEVYINDYMMDYLGKELTISAVNNNDVDYVYDVEEMIYNWGQSNLELIEGDDQVKFNIGDKVKVIDNQYADTCSVGRIGEITELDSHGDETYEVTFTDQKCSDTYDTVNKEDIKHLEMKAYYVFEHYSKEENRKDQFIDSDGHIIEYVDNGIECAGEDITEVYSSYDLYECDIELFVDEVKKMTMEQIEQELGYSIEII